MSTTIRYEPSARLSERSRDFLYREGIPFSPALVRMVMPLVLIRLMWPRWFHARELYSADGAPSPLSFVYGWGEMLPTFSGEIAVAMNSILLLTLVASAV